MKKVTSTLLILGALIMLEANTTAQATSITPDGHQMHPTNILLARLVHGGVYNRPDTRPDEDNRDEGRQHTDTRDQDQQNIGSHNSVNGHVNRNHTYDNGVHGYGGVPSYEHYHWTDGTGTIHY